MSVSNKRGGAAGGTIVLDELSGILWEYWWLDPDGPPSAECWKMGSLRGPQNAQDVRKMQFLENCVLWLRWERRDGEESRAHNILQFSPLYFTVPIFVCWKENIFKILIKTCIEK